MVRDLRAAVEFEQDASGALVRSVDNPQDVIAPHRASRRAARACWRPQVSPRLSKGLVG